MMHRMRRRFCILMAGFAIVCQFGLPRYAFGDDDEGGGEETPGGGSGGEETPGGGGGNSIPPPEDETSGSGESPSTGAGSWSGNSDNPVDDATGGRMGGSSIVEGATGDSSGAGGFYSWAQGYGSTTSDDSALIDERGSIAGSAYDATSRSSGIMIGDVEVSPSFELGIEGEVADKSGGGMVTFEPTRIDSLGGTLFLPVAEAGGIYAGGQLGMEGATLGAVGIYIGVPYEADIYVGTDLSRPFPNVEAGVIVPDTNGIRGAGVTLDFSRPYQSFIQEGGQYLENQVRGLYDYVNFNSTGY